MTAMKKEKNDFLIIILFCILLGFLTYNFVMQELNYYLSDYTGHTYIYLPLFSRSNFLQGWKAAPYFMWHMLTLFFYKILYIPLTSSAAYSACVFAIFSYLVFYWILQKAAIRANIAQSCLRTAFFAFCLCIAQPITFYWLDTNAFSMNPLYNPTYMCARGFSLLCFCLVLDIWGRQKDPDYCGIFFHVENGLKNYYICLSILLFLSAMAKPTFAEMFIPAVALYMLAEWILRIRRRDGSAKPYFRHCLYTLCCAAPTLIYALIQYLAYFVFGGSYGNGDGSLIITDIFQVWKIYSQNVALSIVMSLAFPLFMLLINPAFFLHSDMGRLSLVCFLTGFLEAAFLGEGGPKLSYCNFIWPMMSAMLLWFLVSSIRLTFLENTRSDTRIQKGLLIFARLLFCLHALYGILFFINNHHYVP